MKGYNHDLAKRERALGSGFTPLAEDTKTMKVGKKGVLRLQTHYLLEIDMFRRT